MSAPGKLRTIILLGVALQATGTAALSSVEGPALGHGSSPPRVLFGNGHEPPNMRFCATELVGRGLLEAPTQRREVRLDPGINPGDWLYYDLDPTILSPAHEGPLRARNFAVLADLEQIDVQLADVVCKKNIRLCLVAARDLSCSG